MIRTDPDATYWHAVNHGWSTTHERRQLLDKLNSGGPGVTLVRIRNGSREDG